MATITVTTAQDVVADDGLRSLREAVDLANARPGADTIRFAGALEGQTLTLTQGELLVTRDLAIDGDRDGNGSRVTLSGGLHFAPGSYVPEGSRLFHSQGGTTDLTLRDLVLADGFAADKGGAVYVEGGSLSLARATVRDSVAGPYFGARGGGIYAAGGTSVTISDSSLRANQGGFGDYAGGGAIATGSDVTLTIRGSTLADNRSAGEFNAGGGAIHLGPGGQLVLEGSAVIGTSSYLGAVLVSDGEARIANSSFAGNHALYGGAIAASGSLVTVTDSTLAGNVADLDPDSGRGGTAGAIGVYNGGMLVLRNSTLTGNVAMGGLGGAISVAEPSLLDIANSIVAGNGALSGPDISGTVAFSNGHNLFGSDVAGEAAGDRETVAPALLFRTGAIDGDGVVLLRDAIDNPALAGALSFDALRHDQLGHARPQPAASSPDIGAHELRQALSTLRSEHNDTLTGTGAADAISGLAGNDRILGLAGDDALYGNDGSDTFDGGAGNDAIDGGGGIDVALYGGGAPVLFDLGGPADTARQGGFTDTLTDVEGGAGGAGADTFHGDDAANWFRGGDGQDGFTGGGGRDTYFYTSTRNSPAGSGRDVIADFAPGQDRIDLANIDADPRQPGDQAFHWLGQGALGTTPGDLSWFGSGGDTIIQGSTDTDRAAEFQIQLNGDVGPSLAAGDFYL